VTLLKKATIKSYDAAGHRAAVQIAGSLGVWLEDVPVATDVPAADVVAGRACSVLFLDEGNPEDAVVLEVHGALPSGGGGVTDHGALTGLADDDHPQYGALAQAETVAALWTFGAGIRLAASQAIKDSGGGNRYTPAASSPHNTLSGDVYGPIPAHWGVNSPPSSTASLVVWPWALSFGAGATVDGLRLLDGVTLTLSGNAVTVHGIKGQPQIGAGAGTSLHFIRGLRYSPLLLGSGSAFELAALQVFWQTLNYSGTLTSAYGVHVPAATTTNLTGAVTNAYGVRIDNQAPHTNVTNGYGLYIADLSAGGTVRHLIHAGPATPYLRLLGAANPPNAGLGTEGDSNLYLLWTENGATNLRQVRWRQQSSLGAGDRVLIAV
jgi:hypothetical protein